MRDAIEAVYRAESRRILATLIRLLGDFDLAEEAMQDAFAAAVERWPAEGVPANPRSWLISAGRFRAIDRLRRASRLDASRDRLAREQRAEIEASPHAGADIALDDDTIADDQLRLVFTCCHPALSPDAQIALTLREVCGLTTEAIAHAFLTSPSTIAQRIVRAKAKIRDARIPYAVPSPAALPDRLDTVLHVIYLVFNEGYSPSSGAFTLQAAIAAVHAEATSADATDWPEIVGLYDVLVRADPSPVVELNRAVAMAMRDGADAGLGLIDTLFARGELEQYRFAHSARAELCRRAGRPDEARAGFTRALALTTQEREREFLQARIASLP